MILYSPYHLRIDKMEDDFEYGETETHMEDAVKKEIPKAFQSEPIEGEIEEGELLAKGDGFVVGIAYDKIDLYARIFVKMENRKRKTRITKIANFGFETIQQDFHIYVS